jgi:Holliday junction resolvasome RuvABC endonuclease subunit
MTRIVVGLDPSTWCGMCKLVENDAMGKVVNFPNAKGFNRLQLIAQEVNRTLQVWKPDLILIEGYAIGHLSSVVKVIESGTVVRKVVFDLKIPWMEVKPTSLKLWTTGSGAAKKPQMAEKVEARWGYKSHSDDIIDAYALARMAQLPPSELLAIKGVSVGF